MFTSLLVGFMAILKAVRGVSASAKKGWVGAPNKDSIPMDYSGPRNKWRDNL